MARPSDDMPETVLEPAYATTSSGPKPAKDLGFPELSRADVDACAISSWYPQFARHSTKTKLYHPLPKEFEDYLQAESIFLPGAPVSRFAYR